MSRWHDILDVQPPPGKLVHAATVDPFLKQPMLWIGWMYDTGEWCDWQDERLIGVRYWREIEWPEPPEALDAGLAPQGLDAGLGAKPLDKPVEKGV